jgi:hypothetical protein
MRFRTPEIKEMGPKWGRISFGFLIWALCSLVCATTASAAPEISNVYTYSLMAVEVIVDWTTDVLADEQVEYGTTIAYGSASALGAGPYSHHGIRLRNLSPNTLYHYRVLSRDTGGSLAVSGDYTITTFPLPGFGTLQGDMLRDDNGNGQYDPGEKYIRHLYSQPCPPLDDVQSQVFVSFSGSQETGSIMPTGCDTVSGHPTYSAALPPGQYVISVGKPLPPDWTVTGPNNIPITIANGGTVSQSFAVHPPPGPDITPPVFSGVDASHIGQSSATIEWRLNELSYSQVEYGTSISYGSLTPLDTVALVGRLIHLTGLLPNTLYHYQVMSWDLAGNLGTSGDYTFTTQVASGLSRCDLNSDGPVNAADVQILVNAILAATTNPAYDINRDAVVNVLDLQRLADVALVIASCP